MRALSERVGEAGTRQITASQRRDSRRGTRPEASDISGRSLNARDALDRLRSLWEQSQPQYVLFDPFDVLRAEADAASPLGLCSEDAAAPSLTPSDGSRIDPLCGPGSREHAGHTAGFGPRPLTRQREETA